MNIGNILATVPVTSRYSMRGNDKDFVRLAARSRSRLPMKIYTGDENTFPDSLTPLRFIMLIKSMDAIHIVTV
ncbi:MAG: hypothetical protein A2Z82_06535 [Nitrospirae bacterium GWA2_46_11]|nr:MAG: hypothetical protein A2Z82_06535 [Nitrospirae bacterium GWA2_46_11]